MFIGLASVWAVCGVLSYGIGLHEHKNRFNYFNAFPFYGIFPFLGPVALFAEVVSHEGKWGLSFRPYTREQRWENFSAKYNQDWVYKTREQFDKEY